MDSPSILVRRRRQSSQTQEIHPLVEDDSPKNAVLSRSDCANNNTPAETDRYSLFRFRFWRLLSLAFHVSFMHYLFFQSQDEEIALISKTSISVISLAVAFSLYYWVCRLMLYSHHRLGRYNIFVGIVVVILHELMVKCFVEKPNFPLLFALLGMSFVSYLRAVLSGDDTGMIKTISMVCTRTSVDFYWSGDSIGSLCFAAVMLLGWLALEFDRGFRPIIAGKLDVLLGMLGDLERFRPPTPEDVVKGPDSLCEGVKGTAGLKELDLVQRTEGLGRS